MCNSCSGSTARYEQRGAAYGIGFSQYRLLLAAALVLCCLLGSGFDRAANADPASSVEQGWWAATNPGAPVPALTSQPDVPSDGLEVQGPATHPASIAAVSFTFNQNASATFLTLQVAPNSITAPNTAIEACPLTSHLKPEQGGPIADAPTFDCSLAAPGTAISSSTSWKFDLSSMSNNGAVAVALVPTGQTDRVVFSKAVVQDLAVAPSSVPADSGLGSDSFGGNQGFSFGPSSGSSSAEVPAVSVPTFSPATPTSGSIPSLSSLPTARPSNSKPPRTQAVASQAAIVPGNGSSSGGGKAGEVAALLLVAVVALTWWMRSRVALELAQSDSQRVAKATAVQRPTTPAGYVARGDEVSLEIPLADPYTPPRH